MTFKEALRLVEHEQKRKVSNAGDCGDRWIFHFEADCPKTDVESSNFSDSFGALPDFVKELITSTGQPLPVFVFKDDGRREYVYPSEYATALHNGKISCKSIPLPII